MDALLSALGSCISLDVVDILAKRRTPLSSLEVELSGTRADTHPRRYRSIRIHARLAGAGITHDDVQRAFELSVTKYCSVRASLAADMQIEWTFEIV